jgi:hypothetical protein
MRFASKVRMMVIGAAFCVYAQAQQKINPATQINWPANCQVYNVATATCPPIGTITFEGTWSSTKTYLANQAVYYNGFQYVSLQNNNLNQNPATQTAFWALFAGGGASVSLQTNGTPNSDQTILNLIAGANTTVTPGAGGAVTIASTSSGGATPAGSNQVQSSNTAGTALQVATATQIAAPLVTQSVQPLQLLDFGDSICQGFQATNAAGYLDENQGWTVPTGVLFGANPNFYCESGDASLDINNTQEMPVDTALPGSVAIGDTGLTNDVLTQFGTLPTYTNISQRALEGNMYQRLVPTPTAKNLLQSATLSGGFALDGVTYRAGQGVVSTTNGASFSQSITIGSSGVLEGCYMVTSANTATFTIAVNGTNQTDPIGGSTTWVAGGDGGVTFNTTQGTTTFCAGFRLPGLSPGAQTVTVTQTAGGTVNFQWIGSPAPASSTNPIFITLDVPQLNPGLEFNDTAPFEAMLTQVATWATADGQNLYVLPARAALGANPGPNFNADGVHPTNAGYTILKGLAATQGAALNLNVNVPTVLGSHYGAITPPATADVSQGFTFNPSREHDNPTAFNNLITLNLFRGNAQFLGTTNIENPTNFGGTIFGDIGGSPYYFCTWNRNSNLNYVINTGAPTTCQAGFGGNFAQFGYGATASIFAMQITPGQINVFPVVNRFYDAAIVTDKISTLDASGGTNQSSNSTCWSAAAYTNTPPNLSTNVHICINNMIAAGASPLSTLTLATSTDSGPATPTYAADFSAMPFKFADVTATAVGPGGMRWITGAGAPSGSCTTGWLYTDSAGGVGTTLYACEGGTWGAVTMLARHTAVRRGTVARRRTGARRPAK